MVDRFRPLVRGLAEGRAEVLREPLSLWGGLDPETGSIIDAHHPQRGRGVTGSVLVMPFGRGSSSSASTFLEAVRVGTNPTAVVLGEADEILVLGAIVARALYGITIPVAVVPRSVYDSIQTGDVVRIDRDQLTVSRDARRIVSSEAAD
jgi:predicted aconitase with swiveling domain